MTAPRISVVMPVFDAGVHLRAALRSILEQSLSDLELIAVDDGSTDDSAAILAEVGDPRLRVVRQPHAGMVAALNRGLALARGGYVARMDADDLSLPGRLALQARFLDRHPGVALVGGRFAHIDEDGRRLNEAVAVPRGHEGIAWAMLRGRLGVLHATAMARREVLQELGGYDPDFAHSEDVELFARMIPRFRLANVAEVVYLWRIRRGSICSARVARQRDHEAQVRRMLWRAVLTGRDDPSPRARRRARERSAGDGRRPPARTAEASYRVRLGYALLAGRRWREARTEFRRAVALDPRQPAALRGWLRAALGRPAERALRRTGVA